MVFNSDILNVPLEWADELESRWLKAFLTFVLVLVWVIPVTLAFIMPLLVWNALSGD